MKKKPIVNLEPKIHLAYRAVWLSYLSVLAILAGWVFWISPPTQASPFLILALHWLPLLAFLPGILRRSATSQAWLCFVALFYFCLAVMNAFFEDVRGTYATVEAIAIGALFSSAMMYARYKGRWDNQPTTDSIPVGH